MSRRERYLGHPLTPRPEPLNPPERERATKRLAAAEAIQADPALLNALTALNERIEALGRRVVDSRRVQFSGLAVLDASGVWSHRASVVSRSIWVYAPAHGLYVHAGPRQGQAPSRGAGVFYVDQAKPFTFNCQGTAEWTLYGTAGDQVNVTIFGEYIDPGLV